MKELFMLKLLLCTYDDSKFMFLKITVGRSNGLDWWIQPKLCVNWWLTKWEKALNTHLNILGTPRCQKCFFQMTGIELTKTQLKNKWDRLKGDWQIWQKLVQRQTGIGWDNSKGVIVMDKQWWKKTKVVSMFHS
jgi:hypothetical protein